VVDCGWREDGWDACCGTVSIVRVLHFSGTVCVKDVPSAPDAYQALIGESYDRAVAEAPWHAEDLQRTLMRVQLRYGADGAVMYMLHQDLVGYPEGYSRDVGYLFSRFRGWCPAVAGDVLVCGHDGSADTDVPTWCLSPEAADRCACGRQARGWRCGEGGEWGLACSRHFGVFGDCGECDDMVPDFKNESCDTCKRAPVGGHFVYPGRAESWDRHRCMMCGPIGTVGEVADHCAGNGLCSCCWGHGWIYESGTPCYQCGGPGTVIAQRSFRKEELNDWRRRFPEADAILRELHSQGLGGRDVGEPGRIARHVYEDGQPPGEEAAQLVAERHARGWPERRETADEEPDADNEMLPVDGHGWPWRARSRVCCAAMVADIRPVRRTRLRAVYFVSRDGRRLKWVSSYNHDEGCLQMFTPGTVGELNGWVKAIETDDKGPIAVIWTGRSDMTLWDTDPRGWHPTQSIFESLRPDSEGDGSQSGE
jgi:hypothetical protein